LHNLGQQRVRCLVKLGGAAITDKQVLETLNSEVLEHTARAVAKGIGAAEGAGFVVVHGAGSFGHHQASEAKVAAGGLHAASVRRGFVVTRLSVMKLHNHVLDALVSAGVEAVGVSPMGKWQPCRRQMGWAWDHDIAELLHNSFVPVIHGDCVFDKELGCTILSGDAVMSHIAKTTQPESVVFLTNVDGVFTEPPERQSARLLRHIRVRKDGSWTADGLRQEEFCSSSDRRDTTGGISKKVEEAACIAREGLTVIIAKAGTEDARATLLLGAAVVGGAGHAMLGRPFVGTVVTDGAW